MTTPRKPSTPRNPRPRRPKAAPADKLPTNGQAPTAVMDEPAPESEPQASPEAPVEEVPVAEVHLDEGGQSGEEFSLEMEIPEEEPSELWEGPGGQLRRELWLRGQQLFESLDRIHGSDVETAVHDVRVASRRLNSILGLAAELIGRKPVQSIRQELSEMRRALGEIRDLHIQAEYLAQHSDTLPAMAGRLESLRAREARALKKALRQLSAVKKRKLARRLEGIDALVAALVESAENWQDCLGMLSRATAERFAAVLAQRDQTNAEEPTSLHRLRVAFKKFRYRAEVVGQLEEPPRAAEHGEAMKTLQRTLGELQDLEVITCGLESYWLANPPNRTAQLEALGHLLKHRRKGLDAFYAAIAPLDTMWHLPAPAPEADA